MTTNNNFRVKNGLEVSGGINAGSTIATTGGIDANGGINANGGIKVSNSNINLNGSSQIQFADGSQQTTAAAPFTGTLATLTATTSVVVEDITISKESTATLSVNAFETVTTSTSTPVSGIYKMLINFNDASNVYDDMTNTQLSTSGGDWSLSSSETKFGLYTWSNANSSPNNYINLTNANYFSSLNSGDWTADMWVFTKATGSGAGNQTLFNGNYFGQGPNNIWFGVDNAVPTHGTLRIGQSGPGSSCPEQMTSGWNHVGVMKKSGIVYFLINGNTYSTTETSLQWPTQGGLQLFGGNSQSGFGLGHVANVRFANQALFSTGTYSLPISTDYDPAGSLTASSSSVVAVPGSIRVESIKFADDTVITSAPTGGASYDQSLNTTDSVTFAAFNNGTAPGLATSLVPDIYGINFNSNGQQAARLTADGFLGAILQLPKVIGGDQELVLMTKHTYGKTGRIQLLGNSWGIPGEPVEVNIQTYAVSNNSTVNIAKFKEDEVIFNLPTRLTPLAAAPATPAAGMMAVSDGIGWDPATDGDEHLNIYLNGAWVQIA